MIETSAPVVQQNKLALEQGFSSNSNKSSDSEGAGEYNDFRLLGIVSFMALMAVVTLFLLPYSPSLAESFFVGSGAALIVALAVLGT